MTDFPFHEKQDAPEDAQPLLEKAEQKYGFVPNILKGMSEAPALLEGYMTLSGLFDQTSLSPVERQVVLLAVSHENGCPYCMAAHSAAAKMAEAPDEVIAALREDKPLPDDKLETLRNFTRIVVESRGNPDDKDIEALLEAGYSKRTVLEVILGVGMKTLSNYTNHILDTPLDQAFEPMAWTPPSRAAAE